MTRLMVGVLMAAAVVRGQRLGAQSIASAQVTHGKLEFDAKATLGDFTGTTTTVTGKLTGANSLEGVHGCVQAPAKSLSTNNGHRDHDMANSLEPEKYPTLRFDLDSVTSGARVGDSIAVTLVGRFTLHGVSRDVTIPGFVWLHPHAARFRGSIPVDVKDYKIGGLSKFLGMFKMNEMIVVRMDVAFGEM